MQRVREYYHFSYSPKEAETWVVKAIRGEKPTRRWVKLNTDSSSLGNPRLAGGGGLIWDENGEWKLGFARNIGITTSFQAELWALCDGLSLCVDRNFSTVEVDLDAKSVIDVLTSPSCSNNLTLPLVDDCRLLATKIPQIKFNHCYWEANRSTDKLARLGVVQDSYFEIFTRSPVEVVRTLNWVRWFILKQGVP